MFHDRINTLVVNIAYDKAKRSVATASRTLSAALLKLRISTTLTLLYIPHYWAIFVHDGRVPFRSKKIMIWFRNPRDDPRLRGGKTPERLADLPKLTKAQYKAGIAANLKADPTQKNPSLWPMIITPGIKTPTMPALFFDNRVGMAGLVDELDTAVQQEMTTILAEQLGPSMNQKQTDSAEFKL